jgi:hypothetical protein
MKSSREQKLKFCIANNLASYDKSKTKPGSKNESQSDCRKLIYKTHKHLPNLNILVKRTIKNNLFKHNSDRPFFYSKVINDIIYDEKKRIVCIFKDFLLWDENSDFLKRFYYLSESKIKLTRFTAYYVRYTVMSPIYFKLEMQKIMAKNVKRHKKYMEHIEEMEEKNAQEPKKKEKDFSKLVKSSMISDPILEDTKINYTLSDLCLDHFNLTSDYSMLKKMVHPGEEEKTKQTLIRENEVSPIKSTIKNNQGLKTDSTKVTLLVPVRASEREMNPEVSQSQNITHLTNNLAPQFKKIEFKKLDLKNINNPLKLQEESGKIQYNSDRNKNSNFSNKILNDNTKRVETKTQINKLNNMVNSQESLINKFVAQTLINTNDIKKKFNLVYKVVNKIKDAQKIVPSKNNASSSQEKAHKINKNKNSVIKTNIYNKLNDNRISHNTNLHVSSPQVIKSSNSKISSNKILGENPVNGTNSIYNINLNLNLNLNLNMLNKNSNHSSKAKIPVQAEQKLPLTERTDGIYNQTIAKFNRLLDKTEKILDNKKKNSRNMNGDNYILNYASATSTSLGKKKNLVIKESTLKNKKILSKEITLNNINTLTVSNTLSPKINIAQNTFNVFYKKFTNDKKPESKLSQLSQDKNLFKKNNMVYPKTQRNSSKKQIHIPNVIKIESPKLSTQMDGSGAYVNTMSSCPGNLSSLNPQLSLDKSKKTTGMSINLKKSKLTDYSKKYPLSTRNEREKIDKI